jgi:hypothetical protein
MINHSSASASGMHLPHRNFQPKLSEIDDDDLAPPLQVLAKTNMEAAAWCLRLPLEHLWLKASTAILASCTVAVGVPKVWVSSPGYSAAFSVQTKVGLALVSLSFLLLNLGL